MASKPTQGQRLTAVEDSLAKIIGLLTDESRATQDSEPEAPSERKVKAARLDGDDGEAVAYAKVVSGTKHSFVSVSNGVADDGKPEASSQPNSMSGWKRSFQLPPEVALAICDNADTVRKLANQALGS